MYVLLRGQSTLPRLQPVTRYHTRSLAILLWSHPVIIESLVNACEPMTLITLTSPNVVRMTGIVGTARASATVVRVKVLLELGGKSEGGHDFGVFEF